MFLRRLIAALAITLAVPAALSATSQAAPHAAAKTRTHEDFVLSVRVAHPVRAAARLQRQGYDLVEARLGRRLLIVGDRGTMRSLRAAGYTPRIHQRFPQLTAQQNKTFYGGYRTVDEYAANLDAVAAAHPDLAVVYDIGDSWLKTQNPILGNDLKAICITRLQPGDCQLTPGSAKPRFFVMATIHARELTPTEIADRWVNELVTQYGVNADITMLVDNVELWVLPMTNPDGREIAEPGTPTPYLQRKNADNTAGGNCANPPTVSSHSGIDLNRNHSWLWGGAGTSSAPCDQTYKGTSAASEPETQALQAFLAQLYADNKGPNLTDPAPTSTPGLMLTLHSYGNYVLFPWGHTTTASPNDAGLRSMGFRLSYFNGYTTGQPPQVLYAVSGSTDDWAYGTLGVAAGTIEFGSSSGSCGGFVPAYSCQTTFWNKNKPALVYAAKLARQPYALSLGPNTDSVALTPTTAAAGTSITLTARGMDGAYGSSGVGRPAGQKVNAGEYYLDTPPWAGGAALALTASDGSFNSTTENVRATITTTGLGSGTHFVYVRTRDANGNWGPVSAGRFTLS